MFENKKSSFSWLLILSPLILVFIFRSSNPFIIIRPKEIHSQSLAKEENVCNLFVGKWVRESKGSVYTNVTCSTLPEMKNCGKYGKDQGHMYWRWKPDRCEFPRFDPGVFLSTVRGKTLGFIGDSLARNQMESLLCLLSQKESPTDIYKDVNNKFRTWYFPSHDFTLMVMWAQFLVEGAEKYINGTVSNAFNIHLDQVDPTWAEKLPSFDYIVISTGNWFFRENYLYENGSLIGCIGCRAENLKHYGVQFAIRRVISTTLQFIRKCKECTNLLTLLRTFSPPHFEHGSWFTGGYCNRTRPLEESEVSLDGIVWELRSIQVKELGRIKEGEILKGKKRFEVLDVTKAMMMRADGHPGSHWIGNNTSDCLHWCLPGPIDMWNDLLLETLKQKSLFY